MWSTLAAARTYLDVLLPVLRAVSVPGSVFSELHPAVELAGFLRERDPGWPARPAIARRDALSAITSPVPR